MFCKRFKLKFWQNFCDKKSLDDKSGSIISVVGKTTVEIMEPF